MHPSHYKMPSCQRPQLSQPNTKKDGWCLAPPFDKQNCLSFGFGFRPQDSKALSFKTATFPWTPLDLHSLSTHKLQSEWELWMRHDGAWVLGQIVCGLCILTPTLALSHDFFPLLCLTSEHYKPFKIPPIFASKILILEIKICEDSSCNSGIILSGLVKCPHN